MIMLKAMMAAIYLPAIPLFLCSAPV